MIIFRGGLRRIEISGAEKILLLNGEIYRRIICRDEIRPIEIPGAEKVLLLEKVIYRSLIICRGGLKPIRPREQEKK